MCTYRDRWKPLSESSEPSQPAVLFDSPSSSGSRDRGGGFYRLSPCFYHCRDENVLVCFPVCLFSHARLRCMCTCNRCTFCLCQNFLNSELLQMVRAKLYTVVLRRSLVFLLLWKNVSFWLHVTTIQTLSHSFSISFFAESQFSFCASLHLQCLPHSHLYLLPPKTNLTFFFFLFFISFHFIVLDCFCYLWHHPFEIGIFTFPTVAIMQCDSACLPLCVACWTDTWAKRTWGTPPSGWERVSGPPCLQCWALPSTECCSKVGDARLPVCTLLW